MSRIRVYGGATRGHTEACVQRAYINTHTHTYTYTKTYTKTSHTHMVLAMNMGTRL